MCLLFKTLYLHCTCSHEIKLHQDCVRHAIVTYLVGALCLGAELERDRPLMRLLFRENQERVSYHHKFPS